MTGPVRGWAGVLHLVSEPTLAVTRVCAGQMRGHVEHVPALDAQTGAKGGSSRIGGLTDEGVGLLRGKDVRSWLRA